MPKSQQTRGPGKGGKVKRKHKWRSGEGKQLAAKLASDNADRAKERRQLGRAADDEGAQLFVMDNEGTGAAGMASSKKIAKRTKLLRSEAILRPNMNIPTIGDTATSHKELAAAKLAKGGKRKRTQEQLNKPAQKVLGKTRAKARNATPGAGHLKIVKSVKEQYDLWGEELPEPEERAMQPKRKQVTYGSGGGGGGRQPNTRGKPSAGKLGTMKPAAAAVATAVEVADAGMSYNPDHEQHQELIGTALAQERTTRQEEESLAGMTFLKQKFLRPKKGEIADTADMLMSERAFEMQAIETDRESEEAAAELAELEVKKPKGKLTVAQRNKQAKQVAHQKLVIEQRKAKKAAQDLNRIDAIEREVEQVGEEREEKFQENERKRKERLESTMRLGPHLYQEEILATTVPLTDELKGSMRAAKLKGSLLSDRMRSLEKRNIIEVRSTTAAFKSKQRRYQLKQYTTKAGKIGVQDTIA